MTYKGTPASIAAFRSFLAGCLFLGFAPSIVLAATASADFTVTIGPAPPQTIASITPTSVTVNVTGTTCADGMLVTGLTANMSPSPPLFSGTWSESGDAHFRTSGANLVCSGSVPVSATPYTPMVTATPSNTAIAAKMQTVAVTVQTITPVISSINLSGGTSFAIPAVAGHTIDTLSASCSAGSCAGATFALVTRTGCTSTGNASFAVSGTNLNIAPSPPGPAQINDTTPRSICLRAQVAGAADFFQSLTLIGVGAQNVSVAQKLGDPNGSVAETDIQFTFAPMQPGQTVIGSVLWEDHSGNPGATGSLDTIKVGTQTATVLGRFADARFPGDSLGITVWWLPNVQGNPTTVDYISTSGGFWYDGTVISVFNGIPSGATVDAIKGMGYPSSGGGVLQSPSLTPATAGEFLYGVGTLYDCGPPTLSVDTGWTALNNTSFCFSTADEWQIDPNTSAITSSFKTNSSGAVAYAALAAIKIGPAPPQIAKDAGFTTLAANYDFSAPSYADRAPGDNSNWFDVNANDHTKLWHPGSPGIFNQTNNIHQSVDPLTGKTVLHFSQSAANTNTPNCICTNPDMSTFHCGPCATGMETANAGGSAVQSPPVISGDNFVSADFPNMYIEARFRVGAIDNSPCLDNGFTPPPSNCEGADAVWSWQFVYGQGITAGIEGDYGELDEDVGGFGIDGYLPHDVDTNAYAAWNSFNSTGDNLPFPHTNGPWVTQPHKYAGMLTSDGSTAIWGCTFVDDVLQHCAQIPNNSTPANAAARFVSRHFVLAWVNSNMPPANISNDMYLEYIHVFSCPSWQGLPGDSTHMCNGHTLTTNLQNVTYWAP